MTAENATTQAAANKTMQLQLDGETYTLLPLPLSSRETLKLAEKHILSTRHDPIAALKAALAGTKDLNRPDLDEKMATAAYKEVLAQQSKKVPPHEVNAWLQGGEGIIWLGWMRLKQTHKDITIEKADEVIRYGTVLKDEADKQEAATTAATQT